MQDIEPGSHKDSHPVHESFPRLAQIIYTQYYCNKIKKKTANTPRNP